MGLGVYFAEDIGHILAALASAGCQHGPEYQKALADVARALGIAGAAWVPAVYVLEGVQGERVSDYQ